MTIEDAKRQMILRLDALSEEQYEAVKKCITQGGELLLTEGMSDRYQIRLNLTNALGLLWEECQKGGIDFEKMVRAWQGGDWGTTVACLMLQGRLEEIQKLADSI